jgi:hypothetical protein
MVAPMKGLPVGEAAELNPVSVLYPVPVATLLASTCGGVKGGFWVRRIQRRWTPGKDEARLEVK